MQPTSRVRIDNEILTMPQRWLGLITGVLMLLLLAFFAYHQWKITGFFTGKFGRTEMFALYIPILMSLVAPVQRLIQGKRNPARPIEAVSDLSLAIGSLWLRVIFPFDFTHLADPFPHTMRFAFAWINNDVGKWILVLQVVIGFLSCATTLASYLGMKRKEGA
jgi:hypothetical protein